jgi:DNA-binding MarR family transcriptional regulator
MSDSKLYKTSCMLLDFLSLVRDGLFIENDFTKNFPINSNEFQAKICSLSMPPSHINVILYLAKVKSSPISHIAKKLNISKSNMTPIIDKLIDLELVHRYTDSKDRRILRVELTPKAIELFEYVESAAKDAIKNKISTLSDEDLNDLTSSLDTLSTIFKKLK